MPAPLAMVMVDDEKSPFTEVKAVTLTPLVQPFQPAAKDAGSLTK